MPQPAVDDRGRPAEYRLIQRAGDLRGQRGRTSAADVAEEALEDSEVRIADGLERQPPFVDVDPSADLQLRAFSGSAMISASRERQMSEAQSVPAANRQMDGSEAWPGATPRPPPNAR